MTAADARYRLRDLRVNDVIVSGANPHASGAPAMNDAPPRGLKVITVDEGSNSLALLDTSDADGWPYLADAAPVLDALNAGSRHIVDMGDPEFPEDRDLPQGYLDKRNADFKIVESVVRGKLPAMCRPRERAALITRAMIEHNRSRPALVRLLKRYFERGMCLEAMLPDWGKCGAPGVEKPVDEGSAKRGRKLPADHKWQGVSINREMRRSFMRAIDLYGRNGKLGKNDAYDLCIRRDFQVEVLDGDGKPTGERRFKSPFDVKGPPSFGQFLYWVNKDADMLAAQRRRKSDRVWEMQHRALVGTATEQVWGPGSRYEIDATVLDVYVTSRRRRGVIVGRPTLYVVIDVYSRMIVGIYLSLENPSWQAAMMAISNAASPKVEFCRGFGIEIDEGEWPCQHMPARILGDRAEMVRQGIDALLRIFQITCENAAPYRADWKGVVESRFGTLPAKFAPYVPGYIEEDFRKRGGTDHRLDATVNLDELTRIVIKLVLYYNNKHPLPAYPRATGMVEDDVLPVPLRLWNWGVEHASGRLRRPATDRFRISMMPRHEAVVTPMGLLFEGRYYACDWLRASGQQSASRAGRIPVQIRFDKRHAKRAYVVEERRVNGKHVPPRFHTATLNSRSSGEYGDLSGWEALDARKNKDRLLADHRPEQLLGLGEAQADTVETVKEAASLLPPPPKSARARTKNIRAQRAAELAADRLVEGAAHAPGPKAGPAPADPRPAQGGNVVQLRPQPRRDYSLPQLEDLLDRSGS